MIGKYRRFLLCVITAVILSGAFFLLRDQALARRPFPSGTQVVVKTGYDLCRHEVIKEASPPEMGVLTLRQLRRLYPSGEGWQAQVREKDVVVSRTLDGLCERCSRITHLGEKGGFVAVIRGPAGVEGGIVRVTKTRVEALPSELRRKVRDGALDLPDEESLLQILDSLEEESR